MRRVSVIALFLVLSLALQGCFTAQVVAPGIRYPVTMSAVRAKTVPFEHSTTIWYAIWGLVPFGQPDINAILDEEVKKAGGKGVSKFEVETGMKIPMIFANLLTGFVTVYNQQVIVRGEIYK